jgi:DNA/RNA endonuclease YhcR with UshA esterase domain
MTNMANASAYDGNSNPLFLATATNTILSTAQLTLQAPKSHQILLIGQFSVDGSSLVNGIVVGDIQVNGNTYLSTQVNNLNGNVGTVLVVSGIITLQRHPFTFDLRAYTNATGLVVHHRALSVVDLG